MSCSQAIAAGPDKLTISVGISDAYKIGHWTEVRIVANDFPAGQYLAQVGVLDVDGNYAFFESSPILVEDGKPLQTHVPVRILRTGSDIRVKIFAAPALSAEQAKTPSAQPQLTQLKLVAEGHRSNRELKEFSQSTPWIVTVGTVGGIELTTAFVEDLQVTSLQEFSQLPQDIMAWQGVDSFFMPAGPLDENNLSRLLNWVQTGGSLVLFPNQPAEEFLQLPLVKKLPVQFDGTAQIRDLSRLVSFVGEPSPLRISGMTIPRISEVTGKTLVGGLSGSIVTRSPWGLGQVTVLAVHLNDRPFQNWIALPQLYRLLANLPASTSIAAKSSSNELTQNGLTDIKTQWVAALSDFGTQTPSVWWPLTGLLLAAMLVGPVDYFLVRRILKKPLLTWVTFPILIFVATAWGFLDSRTAPARLNSASASSPTPPSELSNNSSQSETSDKTEISSTEKNVPASGNSVIANQCLVLDHAVQTGTVRYRNFTKLLVPVTGRYQVNTQLNLPQALSEYASGNHWLSTAAVPESSFRGYYRHSGTHLDQTQYQVDPLGLSISGLPIYEHSTSLIETVGWKASPDENSTIKLASADLQSLSSTQLRGWVTHHFDSPISNWVLAYGRILFFVSADHPLAELKPGQRLELPSANFDQKELSAFLTGTTTHLIKRTSGVGEDLLTKREPYSLFSQDLDYILSRLTFHQALGGYEYTTLTNTELSSWDLSPQLELNQAVLIGKLKTPLASTEVDSAPLTTVKNETFVRLVIPVAQRGVVPERLQEFDRSLRNK